MLATPGSISSILEALIESCKDGEQGFRSASEDVRNLSLKKMFAAHARERGEFVTELENLLRSQGQQSDTSGSVAGALHRAWINLKSALSTGSERSVLTECERGEEAAVSAYEDALKHEELPADMREVIVQQAATIRESLMRIRDLLQTYS
jgi:uncharacterized protein (TIGR02284 family)